LASGYGDTQNPYVSKTANYVLAAPNGTSGVPTFRAIVAADIPTLNQNTTGTAAGLSATLAIASGGTGQTSANAALNALLPSQSGQSGNVLTTNGTNTSWIAASGTGTVQSVSVSTANGFAGTVANANTTPAITLTTSVTGVLKGNGSAISAATAGTDYQAPISLTTTGTSGAATFVGNVLNIPQYTGGGGSPAGSDTQVQYNNSSAFGASSAFTFNSGTGVVTATGFAGALNGTIGASTPTTGIFTTATARSTAVQDFVALQGRAGGTNSYGVTITPTTLTASRTLTLPDASGTVLYNGGPLGTPSGGTLTNATGLPISSGVSGLGTGVATFLATPSSANLASAVTDETGSGSLVFGTTPSLTNPTVTNYSEAGVATSGTSLAVDLASGTFWRFTISGGNASMSITGGGAGKSFILILTQDSTPRTMTWPVNVVWPSGTAPTLSTGSGKRDIYSFFYDPTTPSWLATTIGQNY
jgi:hypothetical protein